MLISILSALVATPDVKLSELSDLIKKDHIKRSCILLHNAKPEEELQCKCTAWRNWNVWIMTGLLVNTNLLYHNSSKIIVDQKRCISINQPYSGRFVRVSHYLVNHGVPSREPRHFLSGNLMVGFWARNTCQARPSHQARARKASHSFFRRTVRIWLNWTASETTCCSPGEPPK